MIKSEFVLFLKIVTGAFANVYYYKRVLAKALFIPFSLYLMIDIVTYYHPDGPLYVLVVIVSTLIHAIFAITTHRVMLLGPESISEWGLPKWTWRETRFVFYMIGIVLAVIPIMILAIIPFIGVFIALFLAGWLMSRFSLVFPGIAVDHEASFGESWVMTEKHQLLMFLVVLVFPVLLAIPTYLVERAVPFYMLSAVVSTFLIVFEVTALSLAYKAFSEKV
jgi:hypothetical protein